MRVTAIDDEKLSLMRIERILKEIPGVELIAGYTNPMDALYNCKEDAPEVAFIDVEMPGIDGLALSEQLMELCPGLEVVFVTAHDNYALAAYRTNAIGYLLKPVGYEELSAQISRIQRLYQKETVRSEQLCFKVFGSFYIELPHKANEVLKFRTAKSEELLAFLMSQNKKPVSRDIICDTLWPEMDIDKATRNFHTTAYNIRHSFLEAGISKVLHRIHDSYLLNPSCICSDLEVLNRAVIVMEKRTEDITALEAGVKAYSGTYMGNKDYIWLMDCQSHYERLFERLSLYLSDLYINRKEYLKAEAALRKLLKQITVSEEACDRLLKIYLKQDRMELAIKTYTEFTSDYRKEMGDEPLMLRSKYHIITDRKSSLQPDKS